MSSELLLGHLEDLCKWMAFSEGSFLHFCVIVQGDCESVEGALILEKVSYCPNIEKFSCWRLEKIFLLCGIHKWNFLVAKRL